MRNENEYRDPAGMPGEEPGRVESGPQLGQDYPARGSDGMDRPAGMPARETREADMGGRGLGVAGDYATRFDELQTRFIDDPAEAVRGAESLVQEAVDRLMSDLKTRLDGIRQQAGGDDTERLRMAMKEYREVLSELSL